MPSSASRENKDGFSNVYSVPTYILGVHPVTWRLEFRYHPSNVALQLLTQRILRKDVAEVHGDLKGIDVYIL